MGDSTSYVVDCFIVSESFYSLAIGAKFGGLMSDWLCYHGSPT